MFVVRSFGTFSGVEEFPQEGSIAKRFVLLGNGGKVEDLPVTAQAEHVTDKIVFMEPLHDDDRAARRRVIAAAEEGVLISLVGRAPYSVGKGLVWLLGIIENHQIGANTTDQPI